MLYYRLVFSNYYTCTYQLLINTFSIYTIYKIFLVIILPFEYNFYSVALHFSSSSISNFKVLSFYFFLCKYNLYCLIKKLFVE